MGVRSDRQVAASPTGGAPERRAAPRRHFLGWDGPLLARAADWLVKNGAREDGPLLVALPGRRAGRRLEELLAERQAALACGDGVLAAAPSCVVTTGGLTDRLLPVDAPTASHLARTLVWADALRALQRDEPAAVQHLAARPPAQEDLAGWLALAEEVGSLFGNILAPEGIGFADVQRQVEIDPGGNEARRWGSLARIQTLYRERLAARGLVDPHDARWATLEAGHVDRSAHVVLVGVVEMTGLLRGALAAVGERVTALVFAPEEQADGFDELGCLRAEAWAKRGVPLPPQAWSVAWDPSEQAARVLQVMAAWDGRYAAPQITIGVPDASVTPFVMRRLAEHGIPTRDAAGTALTDTAPARLLRAAADFLQGRRFADLASLLRHPDLEDGLRTERSLAGVEPAALLDEVQAEHLPDRVEGRGPPGLAGLLAATRECLGELDSGDARPLHAWAESVAAFLQGVYGQRSLDRERDFEQVGALEALAEVLEEIAGLEVHATPDEARVSAAQALCLVLHVAAEKQLRPAPRPGTVELLGWLELVLDDAEALVVTGFGSGHVPAPSPGPAFLPEPLRERLGLRGREQRLARDVWALAAMLHSRQQVHLISGRRGADAEPLLPSPLLFHDRDEAVLQRVRTWIDASSGQPSPSGGTTLPGAPTPKRPLPRLASTPRIESMAVTAFRTFLTSPYLFYLHKVLRLEPADDQARELDPPAFGSLAHAVLEDFGRSDVRDEDREETIRAFLRKALQRRARARFGRRPLAAVAVQITLLGRRLDAFAHWQASWRAQGWRVHEVEWKPETGAVPFDVDGEPIGLRGRIDRIDVHPDQGWVLLDYKTGEEGKTPRQVHGPGKDARWHDLQLPLYSRLAAPLALEGDVACGYINLPRERGDTGIQQADWTAAEMHDATEAARQVVRRIRKGDFFELGDFPEHEPQLAAIAGLALVDTGEGQEEETE